ncbi:MAG TPA: HEAT repeat domain-containing protein [Phycisphaerae bacterium]|nr:HEAT repeat domain-containing protein [Phycisphaerae bacterium]
MRRYDMRLALACGLLAVLAAAVAAHAQPQKSKRELDVVAKTALRIAPEHTESYESLLWEQARLCLGGLVAKLGDRPSKRPADGEAYFRLTIEHTGTVSVDKALKTEVSLVPNTGSAQYVLTRQKGNCKFRLARWKGKAYETVDEWSSEFTANHYEVVPPGLPQADLPKWRKISLMRAGPDGVRQGILDHLLPIEVIDSSGTPGSAQTIRMKVTNKAPWPLASLKVVIFWCEKTGKKTQRYTATLNHRGLLMPGQAATLTGRGDPVETSYPHELLVPVVITALPTFDPSHGPMWVRRQVEAMKGATGEARERAAREVERYIGRMTAAEAQMAVAALMPLLAVDAPKSEADSPLDVRRLLEMMGRPAIPLLADALKHENAGMRLGAALLFQGLRTSDPAIIERLREALKDPCEPVRAAAAKALQACGVPVVPTEEAKP